MTDADAVALLEAALEAVADRVADERESLTDLDSEIGDADFGANLHRGCQAALEAVADLDDPDPSAFVATVGETLIDEMAGSSGIVFGTSLLRASDELDEQLRPESVVAFAVAYREHVQDRGDVDVGAKTMYDAVVPAADALKGGLETAEADPDPVELSARAVEAARRGAMFTSALRAKRGRASYTEWRSVGHPDPGAVGTYLVLEELHRTLADHRGETVEPGLGDGFDRTQSCDRYRNDSHRSV
jgi:dihydroxyacetone kinase-like protein